MPNDSSFAPDLGSGMGPKDPQQEIIESNEKIRQGLVKKYPDAFEEYHDSNGNSVSFLRSISQEAWDGNQEQITSIVKGSFEEQKVPVDNQVITRSLFELSGTILDGFRQVAPVISRNGLDKVILKDTNATDKTVRTREWVNVNDITKLEPEKRAILSAQLKILSSDFAKQSRISPEEFVDMI
jgi:hypothetical protein